MIGVAPQEWWFGTLPDWQVWSIVLRCPVACLDGALLGVLTGRWLRFRGASAMVVVALIVVSLLGQAPLLENGSSEWRLWVPWAIFHTGDNADGTQTLIAGNPAAYLGYLLALGALAVLGAMWHDRTARTPVVPHPRRGRRGGRGALFASRPPPAPRTTGTPTRSRPGSRVTRLWYSGAGSPGCRCSGPAAQPLTAVLLARWPDDAFLLAPALLACCAAAAAFVYDEGRFRWWP